MTNRGLTHTEYAEDLFTGTLLLSAESSGGGLDISRPEHAGVIRTLWQSVRKHSAELSPNRPASRSRSRSNSAHVDNSQATRNAETLMNVLRPLVNLLSVEMEKKGEKDYLGFDSLERSSRSGRRTSRNLEVPLPGGHSSGHSSPFSLHRKRFSQDLSNDAGEGYGVEASKKRRSGEFGSSEA